MDLGAFSNPWLVLPCATAGSTGCVRPVQGAVTSLLVPSGPREDGFPVRPPTLGFWPVCACAARCISSVPVVRVTPCPLVDHDAVPRAATLEVGPSGRLVASGAEAKSQVPWGTVLRIPEARSVWARAPPCR